MEAPPPGPGSGIVKYYDPYEGYGYIIPNQADTADDTIFFERAGIDPSSYDLVIVGGTPVTFVVNDSGHAEGVTAVSSAAS